MKKGKDTLYLFPSLCFYSDENVERGAGSAYFEEDCRIFLKKYMEILLKHSAKGIFCIIMFLVS